jgi:hypothetical protein
MQHSKIVGGSTAKRVIACPGSVALVDKMPPQPSSSYANEGTLLHDVIADVLNGKRAPAGHLGRVHAGITLTQDLIDDKLGPALNALDEIDPDGRMEYAVESRVGFGDYLPDVFGSTDLLGRIDNRAVVLDWKFGSGVAVEAEENAQLMFYAAAAMRTEATLWAFEGVTEVELIIVQPPSVKRWVTTVERIKAFEQELAGAVKIAMKPGAPLAAGDHCKWCSAKPVCPLLTGAVDRLMKTKLDAIPADQIAHYLDQVPLVEEFIKGLQALAQQMLEEGAPVGDWKLVPKRATRQWTNETDAYRMLQKHFDVEETFTSKIISPTVAEKMLKKLKIELPADLVVAVSSGNTLAPGNDPRPAVLQIGHTLKKAMAKIQ